MITLITGENTFENSRILKRIINDTRSVVEKIDGEALELRQLPDLLMGGTLFADKRLVIIKNLSENKLLWNSLDTWIERVSDDIHVVFVESKPDKRTKTFKNLQNVATIHESHLWTDRDSFKVEQWAMREASELGFVLDKKCAHVLVNRVGTDQWMLYNAMEKLALLDEVTPGKIEELIEASPQENIFNLFDAALKGNMAKVNEMTTVLKIGEDPYRLFGLLCTQVLQFVALVLSGKPAGEVAREIGVHPFALSKLTPYVHNYDKHTLKSIMAIFVEADSTMKTSATDPWLCVEKAMLKICTLHKK